MTTWTGWRRVNLLTRSESDQYDLAGNMRQFYGQKEPGDKSGGGRELFCRLPLLIRLGGEFDLDLGAEGAGKEKDEL